MRRRTEAHAVTKAENSYDYAGQDPVNGYDLTGTRTRVDDLVDGSEGGGAKAILIDVEEAEAGKTLVLGTRNDLKGFYGEPSYETVNLPPKGGGRWWWSRNKAIIDKAIDEKRDIMFATNPTEIRYRGGNTLAREIRYLKDRGFGFRQDQSGYWFAVRTR